MSYCKYTIIIVLFVPLSIYCVIIKKLCVFLCYPNLFCSLSLCYLYYTGAGKTTLLSQLSLDFAKAVRTFSYYCGLLTVSRILIFWSISYFIFDEFIDKKWIVQLADFISSSLLFVIFFLLLTYFSSISSSRRVFFLPVLHRVYVSFLLICFPMNSNFISYSHHLFLLSFLCYSSVISLVFFSVSTPLFLSQFFVFLSFFSPFPL